MLAPFRLAADSQHISPEGVVGIAIICFLVGLWFSISVFSVTLRESVRWGRDGSGPPISRLGAVGWALSAHALGVLLFASAFEWRAVSDLLFHLFFAFFFFTVLIGIRDYARSRKRI